MENKHNEQGLRIEKPLPNAHYGAVDIQKYITTRQAADYLGVSEKTIRRFYTARGLIHYKYPSGRSIRFTRNELDEFANQGKVN